MAIVESSPRGNGGRSRRTIKTMSVLTRRMRPRCCREKRPVLRVGSGRSPLGSGLTPNGGAGPSDSSPPPTRRRLSQLSPPPSFLNPPSGICADGDSGLAAIRPCVLRRFCCSVI